MLTLRGLYMVNLLLPIIYLSFISLGLPDSLLGAAWPSIYPELGVPISAAGIISMIIAFGTVISSLFSDRLTKSFGAGMITAASVLTTAVALFGFSVSHSFAALCLWAVPYGLGAGAVDAALNNYVALHYKSRHMSWLHCMWGVGATAGPYMMGFALSNGMGWNGGYRMISIIQIVLTAVLIFSLPLWKKRKNSTENSGPSKALSLRAVFAIPGAKEIMICFFCYSAVEQTTGLWAASFLNSFRGVPAETAAGFVSFFFVGITAGRFLSGFLTMKLSDDQMIWLGCGLVALGVLLMFLPGTWPSLCGLVLIGLGCAPIYPSIIHSTPARFGAERSQALVGVQMASAYMGTTLMPPLFGILARYIGISALPFFLLLCLGLMFGMHRRLLRVSR